MARFGFPRWKDGPLGWRRVGRPVDLVVALGLLGLLAIAGAVLQYRLGPARSLVGIARAIDGDSLRLAGEELRLQGLDAPESRQTCTDPGGRTVECGRVARRALEALLARGVVTCEIGRVDRYGRGLAQCRQGETDINATLVREAMPSPMAAIAARRRRPRRRGAASGRCGSSGRRPGGGCTRTEGRHRTITKRLERN